MRGEFAANLTADTDQRQKQRDLESRGVFVWLKTLMPFAFEESFSEDHKKFWNIYWSVLLRLREQIKYEKLGLQLPEKFKVSAKELKFLLIWGRGLGKSQTLEASSVMRGALLGGAYTLYICETQDQANEHVGNSRDLIENEESRIAEFYPGMATAVVRTLGGKRDAKRAEDIFITSNGWICRAKGLNSSLRGLRIGKRRPDDLNVDDIDGVNDSIAKAIKKLRQLTASVFGTQARKRSIIKFGQNLIHENSVMNRIHTGKSDAMAERTTIGVTNTFIRFDYESYVDPEDGRVKHRILPTSIPTWSGVDIEAAQNFLHDSGLETFFAEYQNSFEHLKRIKMVYAYDERRHIISWSQFEKMFGARSIPKHWQCRAGSDIGYTNNSLSAHVFAATSALNSQLPNKKFVYRIKTFALESIDNQAVKLWQEFFPKPAMGKRHFEAVTDFGGYPELLRLLQTKPECAPFLQNYSLNPIENRYNLRDVTYEQIASSLFDSQIGAWYISHEKSGEYKTLSQKYGLPVKKTKDFKEESGVAEWNHLLHGDYTLPHPFADDELDAETGLYKLGCPDLFYVVDDDQTRAPRDDGGMKNHRENIVAWERIPEKLTETGYTDAKPMKFQRDSCDGERMIWATGWGGRATELTDDEKFVRHIVHNQPGLTPEAIAAEADDNRKSQKIASLMFERQEFMSEQKRNFEKSDSFAEMFYEQRSGDEDDFSWID